MNAKIKTLFLMLILCFCSMLIDKISAQNIEDMLTSTCFAIGEGSASVNGTLNVNQEGECMFNYMLSANIRPEIFGLSIPLSFTYANKDFDFSHPFNQFLIAPSYKGYTLKIGSTATTYSPYTLSGHQFTGVVFEAKPQKSTWSGSMMFGKMKTTPLSAAKDTTNSVRLGYGVNIVKKTDKFHVALTIFKAHDLQNDKIIMPKDNFALSIDAEYKIFKDFYVSAMWGNSSITHDLREEKEKKKTKFPNVAQLFVKNNFSTSSASAYKAVIGYKFVSLNFELVEPDYQTLGAYYMNNDFYNVTVNLAHQFKKIGLSGRFGLQERNLFSESQSHNRQFVIATGINYRPSDKFFLSANYSNFQSYSFLRNTILESENIDPYTVIDSLAFSSLNQTADILAQYQFSHDKNKRHSISLQASMNATNDNSYFIMNGLTYSFSKKKSYNFGASFQTNYQTETKSFAANITAFFGSKFAKDKVSWKVSVAENNYWTQNKFTRFAFVVRGNIDYKINKHHHLNSQISTLLGKTNNLMLNIGYRFLL
jgi:hypothetical protein